MCASEWDHWWQEYPDLLVTFPALISKYCMLKCEEYPKEEIGITTRNSQKQNISKLGVKVIFANLLLSANILIDYYGIQVVMVMREVFNWMEIGKDVAKRRGQSIASQMLMCTSITGDLVEIQIQPSQVWDRVQDCVLLTSPQVMLMLLGNGPHFDQCLSYTHFGKYILFCSRLDANGPDVIRPHVM